MKVSHKATKARRGTLKEAGRVLLPVPVMLFTSSCCPHPQCEDGWLVTADPADQAPCPLCNPCAPSEEEAA